MKPFFENIVIALKYLFGKELDEPSKSDSPSVESRSEELVSDSKELRLPFMPSNKNWGEWAYDHRIGLFSTLCFVVAGVLLAESIKIRLELNNPFMGMEIVMPEEPVEEKKEKEIDPLKGEYADMSDVKNVKVNRDMELNSALKDSKGSDAKEIYDQARELEEKMKSSRAAYEAGLRELEEHKKKLSDKDSDSKKEQGEQMSDYKGNVTVSYSLEGRKAMYLHVPAYTCRNGGKVEVTITVNRRGEVIAATVARGSSSDESLREAALDAARRSRFDVSQSAPEKQTGKIYYTFIPQ